MDALNSVLDFLTGTIDLSSSISLATITAVFLGISRFMPLKFGIPVVVTALCGGSALYIILTRNEQWAYAAAGALFGFWMRRVRI